MTTSNEPLAAEGSKGEGALLSKPVVVPTQTSGQDQRPSQGEGEKAPVQEKAAPVPEFSLPEVVITGENELTIGADRLTSREENVTMGSRELESFDRSFDDLPGLNKTFTALATEESGPSRDTALALHLGGGIPGTYGGWGLFGQDFNDIQFLFSGHYSAWGGESTGSGFDGDKKSGGGLDLRFFPSKPLHFSLSGAYSRIDAELPHQGSSREIHDDLHWDGTASLKLSELVQVQMKVSHQTTDLDYFDAGERHNSFQETEGQFKATAEEVGTFLNRVSLEGGFRGADSDLSGPVRSDYTWGWLGLQGLFKRGEDLTLTLKLQGQAGTGNGLALQFFPHASFTWRVFENSQFNLYWGTDRYVEDFQGLFGSTLHVSAGNGFPLPTEVTGEWGGRFTQKLLEGVILSLSGSRSRIHNYQQWTDLNSTLPEYIQHYSILGEVQMTRAGGSLQWGFAKDWQATLAYQWTEGLDRVGSRGLTGLPTHKGTLSFYRGDEKLEARLELSAASESLKFEDLPGDLPAYFTLGLDATYHLTKTVSLWFNGDNLLGRDYEIQPGYLEPKFHVRAGVEVIF